MQIIDGQIRQITITLKLAATSCGPQSTISYEKKVGQVNFPGNVSQLFDGSLRGATIKLTPLQSGQRHVTTSSKDGIFEISGLEPGKYKLQATHRGYSVAFVTSLWITRENLTRIVVISLTKSSGHGVFVCQ